MAMTGTDFLYMLLGAVLVTGGILAAALADRIRGIRQTRETRETRETRHASRSAPSPADTIFVPDEPLRIIEPVDLLRDKQAASKRAAKTAKAAKPQEDDGAEDVIAALVASGYKKPIAVEATWGCTVAERATIEEWTLAALRRCARKGMS